VVAEAETILRLNENLLICSTVDSGAFQLQSSPFDLRTLLEGVVDYFRETDGPACLNFALVYPHDLPCRFVGDSDRIRSVILNLVGSTVTRSGADEIRIVADLAALDGLNARIRVSVTSAGVTMAPKELRSLLLSCGPSLTEDLRLSGPAGIGLAASKMLVEAMGGTMFVEDKLQPSVIAFTLSLSLDTACAA
jgi:signal transduction histidine kinase